MKKILAMGACFAAFPAAAQSSVTIAGVVDVFAGRMRMAGDPSGTNVVNGGGLSTSWFGFLVSEDLGGGLRASAKLTSFFRADTGSMGRFDGDPFFQRDANVALSGSVRTLRHVK